MVADGRVCVTWLDPSTLVALVIADHHARRGGHGGALSCSRPDDAIWALGRLKAEFGLPQRYLVRTALVTSEEDWDPDSVAGSVPAYVRNCHEDGGYPLLRL